MTWTLPLGLQAPVSDFSLDSNDHVAIGRLVRGGRKEWAVGISRRWTKSLALAVIAVLLPAGAYAASPSFSGYQWPHHQRWTYQVALNTMVEAHLAVPNQDLSSAGDTKVATGVTEVAVSESERWRPALTIRSGAVADGGLFLQLTFVSSPLAVSESAPRLGLDQGQTLMVPSITLEGRLASNGAWTIIEPPQALGPLPAGVSAASLIPMAAGESGWLPPVPTSGWQPGQDFIHQTTLNPATLLSDLTSTTSDIHLAASAWTLSSRNVPNLNAKGNWTVNATEETNVPLTAVVQATLANEGSARLNVALSVTGRNAFVLASGEGGLLRSEREHEEIRLKEDGNLISAGTKTALPLDNSLEETLAWSILPAGSNPKT